MSDKRVLLCSVFGPYGRDDEYSRKLNPMELYENQVTRGQGPFSLRMFHRSWGIMMIQANIDVPCIVLDFPTLERFVEELKNNQYDIVGISAIIPNIKKVQKMCQLIRQYLPKAEIVIGGHIANVPDIAQRIDANYIIKGEGIAWFREHLGETVDRPFRHPLITSGFGARNCGITLSAKPGDVAATLIPSVGCPLGCNFCSTSAMFGGKGGGFNFYKTGDELFSILAEFERRMQVQSFFVMDENFLFHRKRALRLLELMEKYNKPWSFYVFTSANVLRSYAMNQLIRLGISWVWMGLEGKNSQYAKLNGINTFELVKELQSNGIHVLGSTIIGLENHTPENIDEIIAYAIKHRTDFHQFMLYTPIPGTPLYAQLKAELRLRGESECEAADIHGQFVLNYRHPGGFTDQQTAEIMARAFAEDFKANGPSTVRIVRTELNGWQKYKNCLDARVQAKFAWEARNLAVRSSALVGAARIYYRNSPEMYAKMSALLRDLHKEFGWKSRLSSFFAGRWLLRQIRKEEKRLAEGFSYEPPTFCERNSFVFDKPEIPLCQSIEPMELV